jgi:hypothetical protein
MFGDFLDSVKAVLSLGGEAKIVAAAIQSMAVFVVDLLALASIHDEPVKEYAVALAVYPFTAKRIDAHDHAVAFLDCGRPL